MTDSVSEKDFRDIVREIATLSADVRHFMDRHAGMTADIDALRADIISTKADVAEIKSRIRSATAYITALSAAAGIFWIFVGDYFQSAIKKIFVP